MRRRRRRFGRGFALGFLVAFLAAATAVTTRPVLRLFFPIRYPGYIVQSAQAYRLDPHMVAAVIRVESAFNPLARSERGATGLMQLMPETAAWIASRRGHDLGSAARRPAKGGGPSTLEEALREPAVNIDYGCWYLRALRDQFQGDWVLTLAAYNSGRGRVATWLQQKEWSGRRDEIDQIPYAETRAYVRRVLSTWEWYKRLYPEFPSGSRPSS